MLPIVVLNPGDEIRFTKGTGVVIDYFGELACEVIFDEVTYRSVLKSHYDVNNLFNKDKFDDNLGPVISVAHKGNTELKYLKLRRKELLDEIALQDDEYAIDLLKDRVRKLNNRIERKERGL